MVRSNPSREIESSLRDTGRPLDMIPQLNGGFLAPHDALNELWVSLPYPSLYLQPNTSSPGSADFRPALVLPKAWSRASWAPPEHPNLPPHRVLHIRSQNVYKQSVVEHSSLRSLRIRDDSLSILRETPIAVVTPTSTLAESLTILLP